MWIRNSRSARQVAQGFKPLSCSYIHRHYCIRALTNMSLLITKIICAGPASVQML